jgi:hypothetical protein
MGTLLFIVILLAVTGAAVWYWRAPIDTFLERFKGYRTVVVNAIPAVTIALTDMVAFLAGFGWDAIITNPRYAAYAALGFNILNIALRFKTTTPIGIKEEN